MTTTFKSTLRYLLLVGILAGLLLSLAACKKKPVPTEPSTQPSTSTEPSPSVTETVEQTEPSTTTTPTQPTNPTETTGPACEHVLGKWEVEKTSTCTTEGSRYKKCILCDQKVETEVIPMTAHVPGDWIVDKLSTCSVDGLQHQDCTQCKTTLIYVNLAKAHQIQIIPGTPATTQTPGLTDGEKCTICKEIVVQQQVIPVLGSQSFAYSINSDNKTCTISGLGTYTGSPVLIPVSISSYKVTVIGDNAFAGNKTITEIQLPNTVTRIGAQAFHGCSALTGITFNGTKEQWNAVVKGSGWNGQTGNYIIRCIDGNITSGT